MRRGYLSVPREQSYSHTSCCVKRFPLPPVAAEKKRERKGSQRVRELVRVRCTRTKDRTLRGSVCLPLRIGPIRAPPAKNPLSVKKPGLGTQGLPYGPKAGLVHFWRPNAQKGQMIAENRVVRGKPGHGSARPKKRKGAPGAGRPGPKGIQFEGCGIALLDPREADCAELGDGLARAFSRCILSNSSAMLREAAPSFAGLGLISAGISAGSSAR